ncbi:hypothetical protein [Roseateles sp. LKC17W]|uniref:TIGR02270 family protein n=1 Tax=Pelomonas margarita TaxID=3299031 RepID=A0ABW7FGY5_9BURK
MPPELLPRLVKDPSPDVRRLVAAAAQLDAEQWLTLWAHSPEPALRQTLADGLRSRFATPAPALVGRLLDAADDRLDWALLAPPALPLSEAQLAVLARRADLLTRWLLSQRLQQPDAETRLQQVLTQGDDERVRRALRLMAPAARQQATPRLLDQALAQQRDELLLRMLPQLRTAEGGLPPETATRLLREAPVAVRERLTMEAWWLPRYNAEQIALVLTDPAPLVRIGLLRRRDIALPAEQINAGLLHKDEELASWYRRRPEARPNPAQAAAGLAHANPVVRRGWTSQLAASFDAAQLAQALNDSDQSVRWLALLAARLPLSDAQLDRCLTDPAFVVRERCVSRREFVLTQARFETLLADSNPNVLRAVKGPDGRPPDLAPFIGATLREGTPAARLLLARQQAFPLRPDQLASGLLDPVDTVRQAFAQRRD